MNTLSKMKKGGLLLLLSLMSLTAFGQWFPELGETFINDQVINRGGGTTQNDGLKIVLRATQSYYTLGATNVYIEGYGQEFPGDPYPKPAFNNDLKCKNNCIFSCEFQNM